MPGIGGLVKGWLLGTNPGKAQLEAMAKFTLRTMGKQLGRQILRGVLGGIMSGDDER